MNSASFYMTNLFVCIDYKNYSIIIMKHKKIIVFRRENTNVDPTVREHLNQDRCLLSNDEDMDIGWGHWKSNRMDQICALIQEWKL